MLLGLAVLVWVVDPNAFKPRIEAAVREATGRDFTLVGDIELGFFPWLALRTGTGQFGNPPGFPAEPMASWQQAQLGAKLLPLIRGELEVDRIRLEGADMRLTRQCRRQRQLGRHRLPASRSTRTPGAVTSPSTASTCATAACCTSMRSPRAASS